MIKINHVGGKNKGEIALYSLSTCGWCRKTKALLDKLGLAYDYIDVDLLSNEDAAKLEKEEIKKWNPSGTYPTLVIDKKRAIINYKEEEIRALAE
ncbi:MAG: glutaredoxin family protein [Candidatus Saganbacteria bacterium]|nr:glutaredoxin family protein [Candidatus Saganbacteria bacterium]